MGQTKSDLENISAETAKYMGILHVLVRLFRPLMRLGFVRHFVARTASGRVGAISRYTERGEYDRAADLAIELLKESRHQPTGTWTSRGSDYWWMYMSFAVSSLDQCDDQVKRDEVIEMGRNGVEPFHGYDAAQSFLAFSRWKYEAGDHPPAIEFAEIAANADESWAEPDFVLGWYSLVLGGGDAMKHFAQAVQKDGQILPRIMNDQACQRHPHIIQKLKNLSVDGIVTDHDGPDGDNATNRAK